MTKTVEQTQEISDGENVYTVDTEFDVWKDMIYGQMYEVLDYKITHINGKSVTEVSQEEIDFVGNKIILE